MQFKTWVLIYIRGNGQSGSFRDSGAYPVEYNNNNNNHNNGQAREASEFSCL